MNKSEILKSTWFLYGRWKQPVLSGTFWPYFRESGFAKELGSLLGVEAPRDIFLDGYHLTHDEGNEAVKRYLNSAYKNNALESLYEKLEAASRKAEERHLALLKKNPESDLEYLEELFASYRDVVGSWSFLFRFSIPLEEAVVKDGTVASDAEMLAHMRPYARTTWLEQQTREIQEMARTLEAEGRAGSIALTFESLSSELQQRVKNHVREFAWFGTHHWEGEGYSIEKCLEDIQRTFKNGAAEDAPVESDIPNKGGEMIWKLLALFTYWRTHCAEMTAKVVFASRGRLEGVARKWGMSYDELLLLSHREILAALAKSAVSVDLPANYEERKKGYGIYIDDGNEYIVTGAELDELINTVVPKVDTSISEVRGTVASKGGVVKGVARIILGPSDFSRFEEGDILIANETTPDFVPLMKKATAIVTDTGGITSHAAIVSRELKVPSVIGTKIATKVFKDGDVVEVDTDSGTIRIMKRA